MNFEILNLQNWDLMVIGIAIAAIGILGFIVYFNNKKSLTNRAFLTFSFITILYGIFNYFSYQATSPFLILWFLRFTIFIAIWHAFSLYHLFYVFPKESIEFGKGYKRFLLPLVILSSILNLTPLAFPRIVQLGSTGQASRAETGPAMALFGALAAFCIIAGIVKIIKKASAAKNKEEKSQFQIILIGTILTFSLLLTFNLILPVVFNTVVFIPLAPVFILPFIFFTAYAIKRFHLFNTKIIATEVLTFLLCLGILAEIVISPNFTVALFRFIIFILVLALSILLNRSVHREVEQREQLEILTKQLGEANEKLKALDQARSEFITIASHQLRTPPATIKWYLGSVLAGDFGKITEEQKGIIEKANRTNNSQISLIDDLLNVSRIERGKMEFLFELTDLTPLAQTTHEQLIPQTMEKGLKLELKLPKAPLPQIMADKEKIRQVMNNLIDNAIKYTKQGTIVIELSQNGKEIRFSVTDTGKGITQEEANSIFAKFSRGKESAKQSTGLGLGLYVAKVIIEQHMGKIWAESQGLGKGSSFIFSLPIKSGLKETTLLDLTQNQEPHK